MNAHHAITPNVAQRMEAVEPGEPRYLTEVARLPMSGLRALHGLLLSIEKQVSYLSESVVMGEHGSEAVDSWLTVIQDEAERIERAAALRAPRDSAEAIDRLSILAASAMMNDDLDKAHAFLVVRPEVA